MLSGCGACNGNEPAQVFEVRVLDGVQEQPGIVRGSMTGFGLTEGVGLDGTTPALGSCSRWSEIFVPEFVDIAPVFITVGTLGTWELMMGPEGWLQLAPNSPDPPLLEAGLSVMATVGDDSSATTAPDPAGFDAPAADDSVSLATGFEVRWSPGGDDDVQIIAAAFTDDLQFLGLQNCIVPDSGSFAIPAWEEPAPYATKLRLHFRRRHHARLRFEDLDIDLWVQRVLIRDLVLVPPPSVQ